MTLRPTSVFSRRAGIVVKQSLFYATLCIWLGGCVSMTSATTTVEELGSAKEGAIVISLVVKEMPNCKMLNVTFQPDGRFDGPGEFRRVSHENVPELTL